MLCCAAATQDQIRALAARSAGLRTLRDYWVQRVRALDAVEILTPDEAGSMGAVTSFRLRGRTSFDDNAALSSVLANDYKILTVLRDGPAGGSCIRVTPSYYITTAQLDKLVGALGASVKGRTASVARSLNNLIGEKTMAV